jgi:hypothetical protein
MIRSPFSPIFETMGLLLPGPGSVAPSGRYSSVPNERRFFLLSDTIPERSAELRPIPCPHCQGQQQGKRSSSKYSAIHVRGEAPESDDSSRDCEAKQVHLSFPAGAYSTRQSSE